jgi:hypothetical protein
VAVVRAHVAAQPISNPYKNRIVKIQIAPRLVLLILESIRRHGSHLSKKGPGGGLGQAYPHTRVIRWGLKKPRTQNFQNNTFFVCVGGRNQRQCQAAGTAWNRGFDGRLAAYSVRS